MPKKLPPSEERFLRFLIKEGGVEEKLPAVAKRIRVKVEECQRIFKLKRVQEALRERMEPVRLEQQRQEMVGAAVAEVTAKLEAEKADLEKRLAAATQLPDMALTVDTLEYELMRIARLDPERHGRVKLAAIQTAFVVKGVMEQGNARRVAPPEGELPGQNAVPGMYQSLFDPMRQRLEAPAQPIAEVILPPPAAPETPAVMEAEEVFDLVPAAPVPKLSATAIVEHIKATSSKNQVVVVEVG